MKRPRSALTLRPDPTADEAAVIGWWREGGTMRWGDPRHDIARPMTVDAERFLVGEGDGRVGATWRIGSDDHRGWSALRVVGPARQGGGGGRALLAEAERRLRPGGCAKIDRQVRATNPPVIAFDGKPGFATEDSVNRGKRPVDE